MEKETSFNATINANYINPLIQKDIASLYNDLNKCSLETLLKYDPGTWLEDRPPELSSLLCKICGFKNSLENSPEENFKLAKFVEYIYGCRNAKLVLPLSFQENLLIHSLSRSKRLISYNCKINPAGSYEFISKWMTDQAATPIEMPGGLVRSVFDNEQVVGKTLRVKADNKVPMSIITSHMYISIDNNSKLQNNASLAPCNWLFEIPTDLQKQQFLNDSDVYTDFFRDTRNSLLQERLSVIVQEHKNTQTDFIDAIIERKRICSEEKRCVKCGAENEVQSRKCTNCKGDLIYEKPNLPELYSDKSKVQPYKHFSGINTQSNSCCVKTGEPDMLNPGSFDNVSTILFNIAERVGIKQYGKGDRNWLFLECDGGIYAIVEKLLFNVFCCDKCKDRFYGIDSFKWHRCSILYDITPRHEFGWLIPMPGLLHVEMNGCKAFFETNWDVMLQDICEKLGYRTPKALDCAKRCVDHHKAWNTLEILYLAVTDELLVPYVRHCIESTEAPSVNGYWEWAQNIVNPNYLYIQQMILTFCNALMLFRIGCRKSDTTAIIAGREKLSALFYARNHPKYQRIMAINRYIESMMPVELKQCVYTHLLL